MGLSTFNIVLIALVVLLAVVSIWFLVKPINHDLRSLAVTYLGTFVAVIIAIPFTLFIDGLKEAEQKSENEIELLCAIDRSIDTNQTVLKALSTAVKTGRITYDNLDLGFLESVATLSYATITNKDIKWLVDDFRYRFGSLQRKLMIQQDLSGLYSSPQGSSAFKENRKKFIPQIKAEVSALLQNIETFRRRMKTNYPSLECPEFTILPKPIPTAVPNRDSG